MKDYIILSILIILVTFLGLIYLNVSQARELGEIKASDAAEDLEAEIADSFQSGVDTGYTQGLNDALDAILSETENNRAFEISPDENTTYYLISPEGCGIIIRDELQNQGCEVRCP